ncbi:MAG: BamA/TamA family outer membrane protein [Gemmatimonadales bacterium]
MRASRLLPILLLALLVPAGTATAQEVRTWYYPYLSSSANDLPMYSARLNLIKREEDYFARIPNKAIFQLDGGFTFKGSRRITARFEAPGLWEGWRVNSFVSAEREARFGFFGLGNDSEFDEDLANDAQPFFYRVRRTRYHGRVEVTRWLTDRLGLALAGGVARVIWTDLPGPSIFTSSFGSELTEDDATGRLSLIYDTRDNEYNTGKGLLLEAGFLGGTGGNGYTRVHVNLRGYFPVAEGTILAGRIVAANLEGTPTLNSRFELPVWENTLSALGGSSSFRALDEGRFAGQSTIFANAEVRHHLLDAGGYGGLSALAFLDAGRVFEERGTTVTTDDIKVGGGAGLAVRILRSTIFTFNYGIGPDGRKFTVSSGWMF